VLFFLATILLASHIQVGIALQKTFNWNIPADSGYNTYQVSIITPDTWQVDTDQEITFRLTLTSKRPVLERTETNWVRITLSTENFIEDSGVQLETVTLQNIGDYWEKVVPFNIQSSKLSRGQTLNASITVVININEFDNIQHRSWEHTGQNYNDPMYVSIVRPILSTLELIAVVAMVIIVVAGISAYLLYRKRRTRKPS
jgi:hypothetical protein